MRDDWRAHWDASRLWRLGALALLAAMTLLAVVRPIVGYDSWYYHFPFSSYLWNIGSGEQGFRFDESFRLIWLGFPKFGEWLQGLFWKLTGSLNATTLPHLVLCAFYFFYVPRLLAFDRADLIVFFFASPMLLLHFHSTYVDLLAGAGLAVAFFTFLALQAEQAGAATVGRGFVTKAIVFVLSFGLAGNTKYQTLLGCGALAAILLVGLWTDRELSRRLRGVLAGVVILAALLANATTFLNLARFANPVYPFAVSVGNTTVFAGMDADSQRFGSPPPEYLLRGSTPFRAPGPVTFILSASELDWTLRGVAPWYNIDGLSGKNPQRGGPSRTGGWGAVFFIVNVLLFLPQLALSRWGADRARDRLVASAAALFMAIMLLPRSFELRYWLFVPLILMPINLRFLARTPSLRPVARPLLGALALYGLTLTAFSPKSGFLETRFESEALRRREVPDRVLSALSAAGAYCESADPLLFRFSEAATGLKGMVSRDDADCR